jgi:hypothetical protein
MIFSGFAPEPQIYVNPEFSRNVECSNMSTGSATLLLAVNSVVDPDPAGFETPDPDTNTEKKSFRIRTALDPNSI